MLRSPGTYGPKINEILTPLAYFPQYFCYWTIFQKSERHFLVKSVLQSCMRWHLILTKTLEVIAMGDNRRNRCQN